MAQHIHLSFLPTSDIEVVVLIVGIILVVMSLCGYIIWKDLFRKMKTTNQK